MKRTVFAGLAMVSLSVLSDGFTPEHAGKMKHVLEIAASPTGRSVAYTLSVPRDPLTEENGSAWRELHVVNGQGESRPFITGHVSIGSLAWTPDGKSITYLAKRGDDKNTDLYAIPIDGGESHKLFDHETSISSYEWRSDGEQFLFVATEKAPDNPAKDKGFDAQIYEEQPLNGQVWLASRSEGEEAWSASVLELDGAVFSAHWSPNGDRLAVGIAPDPLIDSYYMYQNVKVVSVASGEVIATVDRAGKLGDYHWSPDGTRLAVVAGAHMNDPSPGRLFLANAANGEAQRLASDYLPDFHAVEWLDDETLFFVSDAGCESEFGTIDPSTGQVTRRDVRQAPVVDAVSVVDGGERVYLAGSTATNGTEVYRLRGNRGRVRKLTDSNPWLSELDLARQEVIRYDARDGVEIEGVLIYPLNYQRGQRYPLILAVHGGPESRVGNGWITSYSRPGQFAANAGYFVFYPNYRGSTGRGLEYAMSHQADYAGKEFDDLVDAIDYLDEQGMVDPKKVGVTGGSYGGYASAWCATYHTKRFAASVMFVGISDLISKQGTTDIPDEMYYVHARMRPWDDWKFFLERSPIYYAEQAATPILILHGKDDPRVHPSQSLELYRTLKTIGKVPTRLVWYPGEGHGNRRAAARYDYSLRLMRWMDHYLKGPGGDPPAHALDYGLEDETDE